MFIILLSLFSGVRCAIFYPFIDKSEEDKKDILLRNSILFYIFFVDKESPVPGNGGLLSKLNPGNGCFTLSWTKATDDKTETSALSYRVYSSKENNLNSVDEIEKNGEALNNFTTNISSFEISSKRFRTTTMYFNVIVKDNLDKKSNYSSISATIIPMYLYVLNQTANTIGIYTINSDVGTLTLSNTITAGNSASSLYIPPKGNYLFMASASENLLRVYSVTTTNGSLALVQSYTINGTTSLLASQEGNYFYSADSTSNTISLFNLDSGSGSLTSNTPTTISITNPVHLSIDVTGSYLYALNYSSDTVSQYVINNTTGGLTSLVNPTQNTGGKPLQTAIDPKGSFAFVINNSGNSLSNYNIDQVRGEWKRYSPLFTTVGQGPTSIDFHPSGNFVTIAESTDNQLRSLSLNRTDGTLTTIGSATSQAGTPSWVIFDFGGKFLYSLSKTSNTIYFYNVTDSGTITLNTTYTTEASPINSVIFHSVK
ncbi:MAG: beta-propeller fold lactonase family protein [Leptospiraceae bacterium]|nr:beta-propeller fold lactonase family protein [Leptospiraceae bacterium]